MSELLTDIKNAILWCVKSGNKFERDILKTLVGEIQAKEAIQGELSDDKVILVVKKFKKGVNETIEAFHTNGSDAPPTLAKEIEIYDRYIPTAMSQEDIVIYLNENTKETITKAKSNGQAIGVAIKTLKSGGKIADGSDVARAVVQLRS